MKYIDEYRDPQLAERLVQKLRERSTRPARLMEFCGGHTVSVFRHGIRQLLPPTVEMLSGPGCPVCVTAIADLDKAILLTELPDIIVATFGDMLKVPGSRSSLRNARADGGDVRVVYSVHDALEIASGSTGKSVVFLGIGFETTAPTIAASLLEARQRGIKNFYVLSLHKLCPPVMKSILDLGEVNLNGIICPGHVSAIIGSTPYQFIPRDYGIACVVSGFEPLDILQSVYMLVEQVESGHPTVEIAYSRGVRPAGNVRALELLHTVFEVCDANWRGIGVVPASGLRLREEFSNFDAEKAFPVSHPPPREPKGCLCGEILRGVKTPLDCKFFSKKCTPDSPVGPCMVSHEGTCSAYYQYRGEDGG
ncbi:MAG: hydrogenase formation protein HypD [Chloroflexota bacterium]